MKANLSEIVCILDRSGSMMPLTQSVIEGYNEFINKQRLIDGEAYVTTVLFDDDCQMLYDHVDIRQIPQMTNSQYYVDGLTALYDAIGRTVNSVGARLAETPEDERPEHVIFFIMTDGHENYSMEFNKTVVRQMIEHQQSVYSWKFIFMGAGIDAEADAAEIGIHASSSYSYGHDVTEVRRSFATMDCLATSIRTGNDLSAKSYTDPQPFEAAISLADLDTTGCYVSNNVEQADMGYYTSLDELTSILGVTAVSTNN